MAINDDTHDNDHEDEFKNDENFDVFDTNLLRDVFRPVTQDDVSYVLNNFYSYLRVELIGMGEPNPDEKPKLLTAKDYHEWHWPIQQFTTHLATAPGPYAYGPRFEEKPAGGYSYLKPFGTIILQKYHTAKKIAALLMNMKEQLVAEGQLDKNQPLQFRMVDLATTERLATDLDHRLTQYFVYKFVQMNPGCGLEVVDFRPLPPEEDRTKPITAVFGKQTFKLAPEKPAPSASKQIE